MLITDANFHPIACSETGTGWWPNSVSQSRVHAYPPLSNERFSSSSWAVGEACQGFYEREDEEDGCLDGINFGLWKNLLKNLSELWLMVDAYRCHWHSSNSLRDDYKWMSARACARGRFYGWYSALINCFDSLLVLLNKFWDLQCNLGLFIHQQRYRYISI